MAERTFDNRFRHGKQHFELAKTSPTTVGMAGARFEKTTRDAEIGPEIVVMLTDPTPFAYELKRDRFALRLKSGVVQTSVGPILFLLWWIPPVTNGEPFALYEHILNPTDAGVLEMLRQVAQQTHLHLLLIGPDQALLDVYEFESTFGLEKLISISESACMEYPGMDFIAAKHEYDHTYGLMQLFREAEPGKKSAAEGDEEDEPPDEKITLAEEDDVGHEADAEFEQEFLIDESYRDLIDGAVWLAGRLLTNPACTSDQSATLAKALLGLARLPRPTPGLTVEFGFSASWDGGGDTRYWSVHLDETELMWSAGGYIRGPNGGDSFTSFQLSLLRGANDVPLGSANAWLKLKDYATSNIDISATDGSDEEFWERYAPDVNPTWG
jgi:hypothetical protein